MVNDVRRSLRNSSIDRDCSEFQLSYKDSGVEPI